MRARPRPGGRARSRPDGWWYPWIFVGGMALVILVNAGLVAFAVGTFTGIATEDHYRKGLAYATAIEADRRQEERAWSAELAVRPTAGDGAGLRAEVAAIFADRYGMPLEDLDVRAELVRPTHGGHDLAISLPHRGDGRYAAEVTVPLPGQWDARVHARRGYEEHRESRRIFLPE